MDSCLQSVFLNGLLLAVTPVAQKAQYVHWTSAFSCLTLLTTVCRAPAAPSSPHPSASGNCSELRKGQRPSNKKRWREEWRGLNICPRKEKEVQPGRGVASSDSCWEAGFWGTGLTGRRRDTVSSKVVCEEVQRQLTEQSLTSEKLYLNIYVTLLLILFCLGFFLSYEKMPGHKWPPHKPPWPTVQAVLNASCFRTHGCL